MIHGFCVCVLGPAHIKQGAMQRRMEWGHTRELMGEEEERGRHSGPDSSPSLARGHSHLGTARPPLGLMTQLLSPLNPVLVFSLVETHSLYG